MDKAEDDPDDDPDDDDDDDETLDGDCFPPVVDVNIENKPMTGFYVLIV
jgi:hypothetical protein